MKTREEKLEALVKEICEHFDPMFGCINLHRLDDRAWMSRARKALGEEAFLKMFPWWKS